MHRSVPEFIAAILIHLVVPLLGLCVFIFICRRIYLSAIPRPPYIPFFLLFGNFGGWTLIILTLNFWYWSGMAAIGGFCLIFISPFIMTAVAIYLFPQRKLSVYHYTAFVASIVSISISVGVFVLLNTNSKGEIYHSRLPKSSFHESFR